MPTAPDRKQRPWKPERKPFQRETDNSIYNTTKWRKFAKRYKEDHPLCVMCEEEGQIRAAYVADHIIRIVDGGEPFDKNNIQSLCEFHHNQKSGKEAKGWRAGGGMGSNP